mgnify:FL=1
MASNPMQRKARNSFLLGIVVTLLITGAVIAFLILQLKNYKDKEAEEKACKKAEETARSDCGTEDGGCK